MIRFTREFRQREHLLLCGLELRVVVLRLLLGEYWGSEVGGFRILLKSCKLIVKIIGHVCTNIEI